MGQPDYPKFPDYPNIGAMTNEERAAYWKWRQPFSDAEAAESDKIFEEIRDRRATRRLQSGPQQSGPSRAMAVLAAIHSVGRLGLGIIALFTGGILAGRRISRKRPRGLP